MDLLGVIGQAVFGSGFVVAIDNLYSLIPNLMDTTLVPEDDLSRDPSPFKSMTDVISDCKFCSPLKQYNNL